MILTAIISILVISGIVYLIQRVWSSFRVCPICAGVSVTWGWMLIVYYLDYPTDVNIISLLMGGSVVGTAYQLEEKIRLGKALAWKILFIPAGFMLAHNLIYLAWINMILSAVFILILLLVFLAWPVTRSNYPINNSQNLEDLEKKMKNCC